MTKWVYSFGNGQAEGSANDRNLLGGKGSNLAEMSIIGLPVPPGFTITTDVCMSYYAHQRTLPETLKDQVSQALSQIETSVGTDFGNADNPLLVSVRSGARASMPGMMDTVLNLGLTDTTVEGLAKRSKDPRFAYDSYRRFIAMYGNVVLGVDHQSFEEIIELHKEEKNLTLDTDLIAEDWKEVIQAFKDKIRTALGYDFPQDPTEQLWGATMAVFNSWMNQRAITYRRLHDIPQDWGTAVTIQAMVFGNMGNDCATGVAFTRDPSTGENIFYGEYLVNAQGEDVVAGIRTPQALTLLSKERADETMPAMEEIMPDVFKQLANVRLLLEKHYRDMQDIEFTVQQNKLYILQTRHGKRTTKAALKIAVDMVAEGLISKEEAILRVNPSALDQLLHPTLDPTAERQVIGRGLPASPGAASGKIALSSDEAEDLTQEGERVILVRVETSPEDIHGMHASQGILTTRGGMTSHAAVVARGMGRPCVAGASDIRVDYKNNQVFAGGHILKSGETITIDGTSGEIIKGEIATILPELSNDFKQLMHWADATRRMKVRANAETIADAKTARDFGAEGIGLCRTEHMFFEAERITAVREMIMAEEKTGREAALAKIQPMQTEDFIGLFKIMQDLPVTIRLLDPPLHEFLPHGEAEMAELAKAMGKDLEMIKRRCAALSESNPMLGHRGCRLGITFPEIYEMQARAIFNAVIAIEKENGSKIIPEIMIPLAATQKELQILKQRIDAIARETLSAHPYLVGTMIELPRAALQAGKLAESAEFFSFGTNDLTQTTFGISRDDATGFLPEYERQTIIEKDPFVSLDQEGVGELVSIGAKRGRNTRSDLKLGICGEHGGDPASIDFCDQIGLDYVSCSPYRVPIARLAAAQASLKNK